MKGKWIHQKNIDRAQWNQLVEKTKKASIYVHSFYLDAAAIDWEAYVAEDFSFAIPIGITKKGGLKRVYPPLFQGYTEPVGDIHKIDWRDFSFSIKKRYSKGNLHLKNRTLQDIKTEEFIFQTLTKEEFQLKTHAKRKIKRFQKENYDIRSKGVDVSLLSDIIIQELAKKLPLFASKEVKYFYRITQAALENNSFYSIGLFEKGKLIGGIIGFQYKNQLLYFKGAVSEKAKEDGAMYALMQQFIEYGFSRDCTINFGGSRVEGVRFFYQRFNGQDEKYYHYFWDNSPWWFRLGWKTYKKYLLNV